MNNVLDEIKQERLEGFEEGFAKGLAKGEAKGLAKGEAGILSLMIKNMRAKGIPDNQIFRTLVSDYDVNTGMAKKLLSI